MFPLLPAPQIEYTYQDCSYTSNPLTHEIVSSICTASTSATEILQVTFASSSIPIISSDIQFMLGVGIFQSVLIIALLIRIAYKR